MKRYVEVRERMVWRGRVSRREGGKIGHSLVSFLRKEEESSAREKLGMTEGQEGKKAFACVSPGAFAAVGSMGGEVVGTNQHSAFDLMLDLPVLDGISRGHVSSASTPAVLVLWSLWCPPHCYRHNDKGCA